MLIAGAHAKLAPQLHRILASITRKYHSTKKTKKNKYVVFALVCILTLD